MKKYLVFISILAVSCKCFKHDKLSTSSVNSKIDFSEEVRGNVYKIDSINNYYLIYFDFDKIDYKIVSKKVNCNRNNLIKIDSSYNFKIEPIFKRSGINPPIANYLDLKRCHTFEEGTEICNEPGIELYESKNLSGLCIY